MSGSVAEPKPMPANGSAERILTFKEHFALSVFWLATNFHWGALLTLMLPSNIETLDPANKVSSVAWLTALGAIPALLVPLLAGALSDRCADKLGRRRPYIRFGILVNLIGLIAMAMVFNSRASLPNPVLLYGLGFLVVQVGNNIATGAYMGVIPDIVPKNQHGTASGFMAAQSQIGSLAGILSVGLLAGREMEKFLVIVAVLVFVGMYTLISIKETPIEKPAQRFDVGKYFKSLWIDPRKYPDFAWVWITRFLVMMGFYAVMPYFNYFFRDVIGLTKLEVEEKLPILFAIILVVSATSGFLGGKISDKIGRLNVVTVANFCIALFALLFIFCRELNHTLIVGALFGLGYGAYISVDWALGTDVLPNPDDAGKDMAVWHIATTLPQSLTIPFAAWLISIPGYKVVGEDKIYTHAGYASVFIFCSICFALGAVLLRNLKTVK